MKGFTGLSILILFTFFVLLGSLSASEESIPYSSSSMKGKPSFKIGTAVEYYLWRVGNVVCIRWTSDGKERIFQGNITSDKPLTSVVRINTEKADYISLASKRAIAFKTTTGGNIDGFDFKVDKDSQWVKIAMKVDGNFIDTLHINLGEKSAHPSSNPVFFEDK